MTMDLEFRHCPNWAYVTRDDVGLAVGTAWVGTIVGHDVGEGTAAVGLTVTETEVGTGVTLGG